MPVFQVDIEKFLNGEYWSNRYFVNDANLAAADIVASALVTAERLFHSTLVTFTKVRTSTVALNDDSYSSRTIDQQGSYANPGQLLPLFNVLRVDFGKVGGGRPYRKLYRGCIGEANIEGSVINDAAFLSAVETSINSIDGIVTDGLGNLLTTGVIINRIGMRQLRRGSRRRTQPILP